MEFFLLPFVLRPHPHVQEYSGGHQGGDDCVSWDCSISRSWREALGANPARTISIVAARTCLLAGMLAVTGRVKCCALAHHAGRVVSRRGDAETKKDADARRNCRTPRGRRSQLS